MYPCGMMPSPVVYPFRDGLSRAWRELTEACGHLRAAAQCDSCELRPYCPACAAMARAETGRTDGIPLYACRMTAAYCRALCELKTE
jgi:radical SAM protein with 4Fe4S-binding SPASM domain